MKMTRAVSTGRMAALGALLALAGTSPAWSATPDTFQPLGPMVEAREGHTATLLADGTVLLAGGWHTAGGTEGTLQSAERFDPQTGQFTVVGSMKARRGSHAAVQLADGRVLIISGVDAQTRTELATTELFDPATGQFTLSGRLSTPHLSPATALVAGGKVLVAGGWSSDNNGALRTAELFDPATGKWTRTGAMASQRTEPAAVTLPDGRVVVLGGSRAGTGDSALSSVEIYDPTTGKFAAAGSLVEARERPRAALLLDGRILVTGGIRWQGEQDEPLASVEIYDPATGLSAVVDRLAQPRTGHLALTLVDGRVLVAGGQPAMDEHLQTAELVDPVTGKVSPALSMAANHTDGAAVRLQDGRVLITGGWGSGWDSEAAAELFVPGS